MYGLTVKWYNKTAPYRAVFVVCGALDLIVTRTKGNAPGNVSQGRKYAVLEKLIPKPGQATQDEKGSGNGGKEKISCNHWLYLSIVAPDRRRGPLFTCNVWKFRKLPSRGAAEKRLKSCPHFPHFRKFVAVDFAHFSEIFKAGVVFDISGPGPEKGG